MLLSKLIHAFLRVTDDQIQFALQQLDSIHEGEEATELKPSDEMCRFIVLLQQNNDYVTAASQRLRTAVTAKQRDNSDQRLRILLSESKVLRAYLELCMKFNFPTTEWLSIRRGGVVVRHIRQSELKADETSHPALVG